MTDSQEPPEPPNSRPARAEPVNPYLAMFAEAQRQERDQVRRYEEQNDSSDVAEKLRKAQRSFQTREEFQPGDLVQWKTFMQAASYPRYGRPAVVVAFDKDAPQAVKPNSDRIFVNDLVVGFLDYDGDFVVFGTDSRRWQRWEDSGSGSK